MNNIVDDGDNTLLEDTVQCYTEDWRYSNRPLSEYPVPKRIYDFVNKPVKFEWLSPERPAYQPTSSGPSARRLMRDYDTDANGNYPYQY